MPTFRITAPDGKVFNVTGPDGSTAEQALEQVKAKYAAQPEAPADTRPELQQRMQNLAGGLIRGAGSIGATLLKPKDALEEFIAKRMGANLPAPERRAGMDSALQSLGLDTDSAAFGTGKLASEIAGTLGVGGAIANTAARVPGVAQAAPKLLQAIRTSGMTAGPVAAGFVPGAAALATRAAGGAIAGGASAGLVDPESAGFGAAVGGALPVGLKVAGTIGRGVGSVFKTGQTRAAERLAAGLEGDRAAIAAQLRAAQVLVAGSRPSVAQVLRTPQAGIMERVIGDSPGGSKLKELYAAQNAARLGALDSVAPIQVGGSAQARADFGTAVGRYASPEEGRLSKFAGQAFEDVDPNNVVELGLPFAKFQGAIDKYLGPGTFGQGSKAMEAMRTAKGVGQIEVPAVKAVTAGPKTTPLATAVRRAGGLSIKDHSGLRGELAGLKGDLKNLVRTNGGQSPARLAEKMHEAGFIADDDAATLLNALREESAGSPVYSMRDQPERAWAAQRAAEMGAPPEAGTIDKAVPWSQVHSLRTSINDAWAAAASKPGASKEAAALLQMRKGLDDTINSAAAGRGGPLDVMSQEAADRFLEARKSWEMLQQRFHTGPQAGIFRKGGDGQPAKQGGEIASAFWGNRPGLAEDVQSLRRLIDDNPALLGQFRSMVTTEGASTQTQTGNLTGKFARWVDNALPGLKEGFEPEQVKALRRIALDIKRAEVAASAGMSKGSNTYQNASHALDLGLLDSPLVKAAGMRVPLGGLGIDWLRESARKGQARGLADLFSDPTKAADALDALRSQRQFDPAIQALFYRSAPVALTSR